MKWRPKQETGLPSSLLAMFPDKGAIWSEKDYSLWTVVIVVQSLRHVRLSVTPWAVARQAPLSMGILQARILGRVAMPSSRGASWPSGWTCNSLCLLHWQVGSLPVVPPEKPLLQTRECVKQNTLELSRSNKVFWSKLYRNISYWTSKIC